MEQKEIITSIQIMNELIKRNFLSSKELNINVNVNFFKELINKKKLSKLNGAFKTETQTESEIQNKQTNLDKNKNIYTSEYSTETPINDSISVTNFTIPSSIYGFNNTSITNSTVNSIAPI